VTNGDFETHATGTFKALHDKDQEIARLREALERIQHWPMNRDAVRALALVQHQARKALGRD